MAEREGRRDAGAGRTSGSRPARPRSSAPRRPRRDSARGRRRWAGRASRRGKVAGSRPPGSTSPNSTRAIAAPPPLPGYQASTMPSTRSRQGVSTGPAGLQHDDRARSLAAATRSISSSRVSAGAGAAVERQARLVGALARGVGHDHHGGVGRRAPRRPRAPGRRPGRSARRRPRPARVAIPCARRDERVGLRRSRSRRRSCRRRRRRRSPPATSAGAASSGSAPSFLSSTVPGLGEPPRLAARAPARSTRESSST